jgi:hypothetical protein
VEVKESVPTSKVSELRLCPNGSLPDISRKTGCDEECLLGDPRAPEDLELVNGEFESFLRDMARAAPAPVVFLFE